MSGEERDAESVTFSPIRLALISLLFLAEPGQRGVSGLLCKCLDHGHAGHCRGNASR